MPLTRNGVTFTDAYTEAATIARNGVAMLDCLELYHSLVGRIRFVNDHVSFFGTLEATAPADASTEVEFLPCPVRIKPAEESDSASSPEYVLEVDNLVSALSGKLRITRGSLLPWYLTARKYASNDPSGPAQLPVTVVLLNSVSIDGPTASLSFGFGDAGNVGIPGLTFNRDEYPTLVP